MVDPNVLKIVLIQKNTVVLLNGNWKIAMLNYQIGDIRMFYENDVRFLEQFKASI
jgi:phenylalanyl-tRNA synthetase alpha chain